MAFAGPMENAEDQDVVIQGTITLDGRPLADAAITLESENGRRVFQGRTDELGRYQLEPTEEQEGGLSAEFIVRIFTAREATEEGEPAKDVPERVPARYNTDSQLTIQVETGKNTFDFALAAGMDAEVEEVAVDLEQLEWAPAAQDPQVIVLSNYARVECALVKRLCELSTDQQRRLEVIDAAWLQKELKLANRAPVKGLFAGIARFLGGGADIGGMQNQNSQEVVGTVRKVIDKTIADALTEAQREKLGWEKERRKAYRTKALATVIIAALDRHLFLSSEQHEGMLPEVVQWVDGQDLYWVFYFQNQSYLPDLPKRILNKHLEPKQLEALKGFQKWNYSMDDLQIQMMGNQFDL